LIRARSSAGEHYVDIVGVAGSIPAAPTILQIQFLCLFRLLSGADDFAIAWIPGLRDFVQSL
jgi:hypothetical protein